jgi:aldehyde dehydrogenase (NAD+)
MRIASHEVFGPVASIIDADDFEHALELANEGGYGLSSAIVTNDLAKAVAFARGATSGMVHINRPTVGSDPQMPFGGTRASSHGPAEQGVEARHFYTHTKTVYLHST